MLVRGDPPDCGYHVDRPTPRQRSERDTRLQRPRPANVPPASDPCWTARVGILAALLRKRGPLPTTRLLDSLPWSPMVSRQVLAAADGDVAWFRDGLWSVEPSRKPAEPCP